MKVSSEAKRSVAAGSTISRSTTLALGAIQVDPDPIVLTGDGSDDYSAPLQFYRKYTDATGVQTLNLGALTGPLGETVDFAGVREVIVRNLSADAADVLVVGPAAANGYAGDLAADPGGTDTPQMVVNAGAVKSYAAKPIGTPHDVTTNGTIELDFGANTFSAEVIVKGNA